MMKLNLVVATMAAVVLFGSAHASDQSFDPAPPDPPQDLTATQVTAGNPAGDTTLIDLTWATILGGRTITLFRKGFGNYPEYDDPPGAGSVPAPPVDRAAALTGGWVEVITTTDPSWQDHPLTRDRWYYVGIVTDGFAQDSAVSALTAGVLNYHLGDVSRVSDPPVPEDATTGDNVVNTVDVTSLGSSYAKSAGDVGYRADVDVGPTDDMTTQGMPQTDNMIGFEDLMMFSINFALVSKQMPSPAPAGMNAITLRVPPIPEAGEEFLVTIHGVGDGTLQGLSIPLNWNADVVRPTGIAAGDLMMAQGEPYLVLSPQPGTVDVALMGVRERGISGEGILATVNFQVLSAGEPELGIGKVEARGQSNQSLSIETMVVAGDGEIAEDSRLAVLRQNFPNPFNPLTHIQFDLERTSSVLLRVYSAQGRLVTTLVDQALPAGQHTVQWDGKDAVGRQMPSGAYLFRLESGGFQQTGRMMLVK